MFIQQEKVKEMCFIIYAFKFFNDQKVDNTRIFVAWVISYSSLFCCRHKPSFQFFPLKLGLQKLEIFTEINFFFFSRTLRAPEVFLHFTYLGGAQKVLQNWWGE